MEMGYAHGMAVPRDIRSIPHRGDDGNGYSYGYGYGGCHECCVGRYFAGIGRPEGLCDDDGRGGSSESDHHGGHSTGIDRFDGRMNGGVI